MSTPEIGQGGETMPLEIERKFLVAALPENLSAYKQETILQGYLVLGNDGSEARVRCREGSYSLTIKSKGDLSRGEWETEIDMLQFATSWPATNGKRIEKTRYSIPHGGAVIELDVYSGSLTGLLTAEVEFPDEATASYFDAPEWIGAEVTTDKRFKNQQLAINGLPDDFIPLAAS